MIEHGADVEAVSTSQSTDLHYAGAFNQTGAVGVLVGLANMEAQNRYGDTPFTSHFLLASLARPASPF